MTDEKLYPVDYIEPEPTPAASPSRDTAGALALIRAAVPKGGAPMTTPQLVALICGRYVRTPEGAFKAMDAAPDASANLVAARAAAIAGEPLKGPAAFASLTVEEVEALVQVVADERRASWKLLDAAAAVALEAGVIVEEVVPK